MMNHCVPDFEIDDDYGISTSSAAGGHGHGGGFTCSKPKKNAIGDDEGIMELLWQNGQVVLQSQNQRSSFKNKAPNGSGGEDGQAIEIPTHQPPIQSTAREIRSFENVMNMPSNHHHHHQLFMQEDEMASWLHYPLPNMDDSSFVDRDLYPDDLLYPPPSREIRSIAPEIRPLTPPPNPATSDATAAPRSPIPPPEAAGPPRFQNFMHFSRLPKSPRMESGPSTSARELTVVDSNDTPTLGTADRLVSGGNVGCGAMSCSIPAVGTSTAAAELATACELTVSSSPGASGGSASASAGLTPQLTVHKPSTTTADDRKRKGRETDDNECQSEDADFESADAKKQARGSTSTKRSRAAEVHNLSERRRRDRINEKMRALQELIPRCNKSDKASMLDEAIEYLKSLQLQVQMMSMGCGMLPLMYPGVQQYMPAMGMGMGMEMGMSRPMMPYPSLIPASGMPSPAVAANMGPRFPMPAFHMQPVSVPDSSRIQGSNQLDPMLNPLVAQNPNQPRMPNFPDPYQQFISLHQTQVPIPQNQVAAQPNKLGSSRGVGNPQNNQSG